MKTSAFLLAREADLLCRTLHWEEAAAAYEAALTLDDRQAEWHAALARARSKMKHWQEAAAAYEAALTLDDRQAEWHAGLARVRTKMKQWEESQTGWSSYADYKEYMQRCDLYSDKPINPPLCSIVADISPGSRVLDVGCGNGRLLVALEQKGCQTRGIDLAPAAVVRARDKGLNVINGDVDNPSPDIDEWLAQSYDAVTFCKSLSYIKHRDRLFTTLKTGAIYVHESDHFGAGPSDTPSEIVVPSKQALRQWGESFGFRSKVIYMFERRYVCELRYVVKFWRI